MLEVERDACTVEFLILVNDIDGLIVVGHGVEFVRRSVFGHLNLAKYVLYLSFKFIHIHVTHDDDTLKVGAVPLVVVIAKFLVFKVFNNLHRTDRKAIRIAAAGHEEGEGAFVDTHCARVAHTPFFLDHTTLLVDFFTRKCKASCPVVENVEHTLNIFGRNGHVADVVNRFVTRCVSVEVVTKLHTDAFAILYEVIAAGEVLRTVETHVFEEVSKPALAVFFLNGTHLLRNVEVCEALLFRIVADVVSQTVFQLTVAHCRVQGKLGHLLRHAVCREHCGKQKAEKLENVFHFKVV